MNNLTCSYLFILYWTGDWTGGGGFVTYSQLSITITLALVVVVGMKDVHDGILLLLVVNRRTGNRKCEPLIQKCGINDAQGMAVYEPSGKLRRLAKDSTNK